MGTGEISNYFRFVDLAGGGGPETKESAGKLTTEIRCDLTGRSRVATLFRQASGGLP